MLVVDFFSNNVVGSRLPYRDWLHRLFGYRARQPEDAASKKHAEINLQFTAYLAKSSLGVAIAALLILTPFSVSNLLDGRYLIGGVALFMVGALALIAWSVRAGRYHPMVAFWVVVPLILIFLSFSFPQQGVIAALWCYPGILTFYFVMTERPAWVGNVLLLAIALPNAWEYLDPGLASRVTATLLTVSIFTAVFVRVINVQQMRLAKKELQRREGMANVSHELRTPLAILVAEVEAMRDGIRPVDDNQLGRVAGSLDHLSGLVDDLYQLALADVGELKVAQNRLRLDELVNDALDRSVGALQERQIDLQRRITSDLYVDGDARRLRQIIDNLLQNCGRYTVDGGTVWVELLDNGKHLCLNLRDSGPGVDQATMHRLFDRFYRAERSRSRETGGSGIGLALVKVMVEAHGGEIKAYPSVEGGLGFRILLPKAVV